MHFYSSARLTRTCIYISAYAFICIKYICKKFCHSPNMHITTGCICGLLCLKLIIFSKFSFLERNFQDCFMQVFTILCAFSKTFFFCSCDESDIKAKESINHLEVYLIIHSICVWEHLCSHGLLVSKMKRIELALLMVLILACLNHVGLKQTKHMHIIYWMQ